MPLRRMRLLPLPGESECIQARQQSAGQGGPPIPPQEKGASVSACSNKYGAREQEGLRRMVCRETMAHIRAPAGRRINIQRKLVYT